MTAQDTNLFDFSENTEEEFSIPLDLSDIIFICQEYYKLGWHIQSQIEYILENGVDESVKSGVVKKEALPHIKNFLKQIYDNGYFGDASSQAQDCIELIKQYEEPPKQFNLN